MERLTRTRLITALLLTVVFGSGVMLGLAADSSLIAEQPSGAEAVVSGEADVAPAPEAERRYVYQEVGPNELQLARIDSVVAEHRARRDALDEETKARYDEARRQILLDTREGIKAVLTPEQAAQYQRLLDEWETQRAAGPANEDDRN
jgi:hypothetical protein